MKSIIFIGLIGIVLSACQSELKKTSSQDLSQTFSLIQRNADLMMGKEWEQVHNAYTKNIQKLREQPEDAKAKLDLAELFMQEARVTGEHGHYYPLALLLADQVLIDHAAIKDHAFRALSDKASVLLSLHQFVEAKEVAVKAIKINPYNAQIYGALVDAHIELGEYEEAVNTADKMVAIRPDLRSYSRISYLRELYGDLDGAIDAMNQAVEAGYPGYEETSWARMHLGDLYLKAGKPDFAEMHYRLALEQRPGYPFALAALGNLEMQKQNYPEAEKLLDQAIQSIPEVGFYITKAELKLLTNKPDEANQLAKEVIEMLKEDEQAGHKMDLTYAYVYKNLLADPKTSLQYVQKEHAVRPNNIEVNQYLADIYAELGDKEKANQFLAKSAISKI
ncbi:MAG: tetratricopeptide repeat protein [Saprospiraceae bacterium]|nr:tetratricopeptide repeat protein [Saprospiraceae bacterium]